MVVVFTIKPLIGYFHGGVARDVVVEVAGLEVVGVGGDGGQ